MHPFYVAEKVIIILPNVVTLTTGSVKVGAWLSTASATVDELRNRVYQNTLTTGCTR